MSPDDDRTDLRAQWVLEVLGRYERGLIAYAARLLGEPERARDVVQETFLRLCKARREEVEPHLSEWLYRVCRNQALDQRRKESRMHSIDGTEETLADARPAVSLACAERESASHLLALLERLPERQQEALRLKFQHGLSYKEIAQVMGESVGNVGWWIHAGIQGLRVKLASRGNEA